MSEQQFLNKDITVRKFDNSSIRGICINETSEGVTVAVAANPNKLIFIPFASISEIVTSREVDK